MNWLIFACLVMLLLVEIARFVQIVFLHGKTERQWSHNRKMSDENVLLLTREVNNCRDYIGKLQAELGFYKNVNPSHEPSRKEQYEN